MASDLPPIDTSEDVEKYEALAENKEIGHTRCKHNKAYMSGQELRCVCGAAWSGPRIHELLEILKKQ